MGEKNLLNRETLNLLERLGLNQYESKVYISLISAGTATAGEISEFAKVPRSRVYDVLTSLEKKGFAIIQVGRPVKYVPVKIEDATEQVRQAYKEEFDKNLEHVGKLEDGLRKALSSVKQNSSLSDENAIRVLKGRNNLYTQIKKMIESSETSIDKMTCEDGIQGLDKYCKKSFEASKRNGIRNRIIIGTNKAPATKHVHRHAEIRTNPESNGRVMIKDGKEVVLVTKPDETGLWVNSPYLAKCFSNSFDNLWKSGK